MTEANASQPDDINGHDDVPSDVLVAHGLVLALGGTAGEILVVETDTGIELSFRDADGSTAA